MGCVVTDIVTAHVIDLLQPKHTAFKDFIVTEISVGDGSYYIVDTNNLDKHRVTSNIIIAGIFVEFLEV